MGALRAYNFLQLRNRPDEGTYNGETLTSSRPDFKFLNFQVSDGKFKVSLPPLL